MGSTTFKRLRAGFLALVLLSLVFYLASTAWHVISAYGEEFEHAEFEAGGLLRALDERAAHIFGEADGVLRLASEDLRGRAVGAGPGKRATHELLVRALRLAPLAISLAAYDADGRLVSSTVDYAAEHLPLGTLDYLQDHRTGGATDLLIGASRVDNIARGPYITVSRAVSGPNGALAAVVTLNLDPGFFERLHGSFPGSPRTSIALLRSDGMLIAHYPGAGNLVGRGLFDRAEFRERLAHAQSGVFRGHSPMDDSPQFYAFRSIAGLPIVGLVGVNERDVLAPWYRLVMTQAAISLVVCAFIAIFGVLLLRQLRSLERASIELSEKQRELEAANRIIRSAQARIEDAIESLPHGVALWDRDDRLVLYNRKFLDDYPFMREIGEPAGMSFAALARLSVEKGVLAEPPAGSDRERWLAERLRAHRDPPGRVIEQRLADGRVLEIIERQTRDGGIVGVRVDVTETKLAEQRSRESEQRLRTLLDLSSDWYWEQDEELRFTHVEGLSGSLRGYTRHCHAITGMRHWEVATAQPYHGDWEEHKEMLAARRPFAEFLAHIENDAGERRIFSISGEPRFDADNRFAGYHGVGNDVTDRVVAEERLRESERRFRGLTALSSDWYWEQDEDFRFVARSGGRDAALELSDGELLGKARWELPRTRPLTGTWEQHQATLERHDPFTDFIMEREGKDGTRRYISVTGRPNFDSAGRFTGYLGIAKEVTERVRAEAALRESEGRYRSVIEVLEEGILVRGRDETFIACNASAEKLLGVPRQKILGRRSLYDLMRFIDEQGLPLQISGRRAGLTALHEGTAEHDFVFGIRREDGALVWMNSSAHPVFYEGDSKPALAVVSMTDITRRKQAEAALRESEARYRSVIYSLHEGVLVRDRDETFVACNNAAERILGITAEQIVGKKNLYDILRFVNDDGTPATVEQTRRAGVQSLRTAQSETNYLFGAVRPDGKLVWVSANAEAVVYPGEREPRGAVISMTDITEQRLAEQQLRASQALNRMLALALRQSTDAIVTEDLNGVVTSWNQGCVRLYGYSAEEAVGRRLDELQLRQLSEEEYAQVLSRLRAGRHIQDEGLHTAKDGRNVIVLTVRAPLHNDRGELVGAISSSRDITELRRAQAEIEKLNRELEQRVIQRTAELEAVNRELEAFSYSVSHDLRAPLRSIDGFSELLLERYRDRLDGEGQSQLLRVRVAAQRMAGLIDDLLKLSRVTRHELRRQEVDLSALAETILGNLAHENPDRAVQARVQAGLKANADPGLMRIVLENLIGNAWKFTSRCDSAKIEVGTTRITGSRAFYVRDDGAGFDMEYADRLFGAFQRLHSDRDFEGSGIGLATVQRILLRHGGRIWAQSEVGKGATFYFALL